MALKSIFTQFRGALLLCLLAAPVLAAQKLNCDSSCGGSGSTGNSAIIAARSAVTASRGPGAQLVRGRPIAKTIAIPGSSSFTYAVPLFGLPGRGLNLNLTLYYNSFIWTSGGRTGSWLTLNADRDTPSYGFRLDFGWLQFCCAGSSLDTGVLTEANGAKHPIGVSASGQYATTDSSYIQLQETGGFSGWIATYKNGTRVTYTYINPNGFELAYRPTQIEDTNGNVISITYLNNTNLLLSSVTDTDGRTIKFFYDTTGTMLSCVTTGASCSASGATTYAFTWNSNYVLNFNFSRSTGTTLQSGATVLNVLTGVTRPDKTGVGFSYGDWAIVNKVQELSKTGNSRYSTSFNFPAASAGPLQLNPTYTQQTVFDGVQTAPWNFRSTVQSTSGVVTSMAITNPTGTTDTTNFSSDGQLPIQDVTCGPGSLPFCQSGTGTTILRTINETWIFDINTGFNPQPATVTTILEDGQTQSESVFNTYDANGNLTDLLEYDFGSGAHGALLREGVASYASLGSSILDRPSDVQIKAPNGSVLYHKKFNYDESGLANVTANLPGRDPNFSATVRGNLTSTVVYANAATTTGAIDSTFTYDVTGNLLTAQSGCCITTERNFSATTQYAYPDSIVVGPTGSQLTTNFTYNMSTGTVATTTDPNGLEATFQYDVDNRPTTTTTPDNITFTNAYDDSAGFPSVTVSNSANSLISVTTLNGIGGTLTQQELNGTSPVSTRAFSYDLAGRLSQASNPYGSDTPVYTTYQYDALGRVTSVTPPAQNTATSQNSYGANYSLTTLTATDPAGKQRKHYADALGRLIRVDEPGLINGQAASASATISGAEQSVATSSGNGASAGTATVAIGGAEGSTVVLTHAATPASVTVTIGGSDGIDVFSTQVCTGGPPSRQPLNCHTVTHNSADTGTIQFTVTAGGTAVTSSAPYGAGVLASNLATTLFNSFPANSVVTMSNPNGSAQFTLTTTATGSASNSANFSAQIIDNCQPSDTQGCSEGYTIGAGNFSSGTDPVNTTMYDTGAVTVSVAVNGTHYSKTSNYGQNGTATSIANDLSNQINSDATLNKLIIAGVSGGSTLQLTTTATGASTNYPLSVSSATTSQYFTSGSTSFPATPSGSTFTPGQNGTLYDSGTIKATLTGFSETPVVESASFGQGSTPASITTSLAAAFHNDPYSPVDATAASGSSTITFTARTQGTDANAYSISVAEQSSLASSFPTPSFASVSLQLAGGVTPTPSLDPTVVLTTTYSYDAMGNLLQSVQGQQTRTYQYDSLSRVTSSVIPETGYQAATASYTDFAAPSQIVDPRLIPGTNNHITTTFAYDSLNRPQTITYNDGTPTVTFTYKPPGSANNTGGRLSNITNGVAAEAYQYDPVGRVAFTAKMIGGQSYNISYQYNPDGTLSKITYPSGRIVTLGEDAIGRLSQIGTNGSSLLNIGSYNAAGEVLNETYGNGVTGTYTYNGQLQPATLQYTGVANMLKLTYNYGGAQDNGTIQGITDGFVASRSTSYVYDELGRLKTAQTNDLISPNTWKLQYTYDRYGNRLSQTPVAGTASMPMNEILLDPTTNRISQSGYLYDAAGNLVSDGLSNYAFDAESRLISAAPVPGLPGSPATFLYDANGLRVNKNGTIYFYSGNSPIAEYNNGAAAGSPNVEYIYARSQRIASIAGSATTYYYPDLLSSRSLTDGSGNQVGTSGLYPFGEQWYQTGTISKWAFTTYEGDRGAGESGMDYATARFYSSRLGRYVSRDPLSGVLSSPQSLNRYSYAANDPIDFADPDGRACGFVAGINTPAKRNDSLLAQFNIQPGIYTYAGGRAHGIGSVVRQDMFGPSSRTHAGALGMNALFDPNDANILIGYSGGAEIISSAVSSGQVNLAALNVTLTIYLSPGTGLASELPSGIDGEFIFHGTGRADFLTTLAQRLQGNTGGRLPCSHTDLACMLKSIQLLLLINCRPHIDPIPGPTGTGFIPPQPIIPLPSDPPDDPDPNPNDDCGVDCGGIPAPGPPELICRSPDPNACPGATPPPDPEESDLLLLAAELSRGGASEVRTKPRVTIGCRIA